MVWNKKIALVKYVSYEEAKKYVQKLNIKGPRELTKYKKNKLLPPDISPWPQHTYRNEYEGAAVFFGHTQSYKSYEEAKKCVRKLNIKTILRYQKYNQKCRKDKILSGLPKNPVRFYKKEWEGWHVFCGLEKSFHSFKNRLNYKSYEEAKKCVQKLNIKSVTEFKKYKKNNTLPSDIPTHAERFYKKEWKGWGDFLGN